MKPVLVRLAFPLIGVLALLVAASGVGLTFAIYNKAFQESVPVTVLVEEVGEQLDIPADVKVRGVRVGEVRGSEPNEDGAVELELALEPDAMALIPADVSARILPKTLFGERYVDLFSEQTDPTVTLAAGAVVRQDLSARSVQLQEVFDELAPLLRTVQPADLNATLSSLATALGGRGEQLGGTIDQLAAYADEVRTFLPELQTDIALLADVSERYGDAAPALLETARNTTTTARTLAEKEEVLAAVLRDTYAVSGRTGALLAENEERLVRLSATLRPTLGVLAEYSPEFDCVFNGAKLGIKRIYDVFGGDDGPFKIRGRLRLGQSRGVYTPALSPAGPLAQQLVAEVGEYGPSCPKVTTAAIGGVPGPDIPEPVKVLLGSYRGPLGLPIPGLDSGRAQNEEVADCTTDGQPDTQCVGDEIEENTQLGLPGLSGLTGLVGPPPAVLGDPTGSLIDRAAIERAAAAAMGRTDGDLNPVTSLLLGPMLRGTDVEPGR